MKKLFVAAASAAVIALSGCATIQKSMDAESAIAKAESGISAAKHGKYLWRDTGKVLKHAKKAYSHEDYDEALKLANKALKQTEDAKAQAAAQKNAGPMYF
jgi:hypothetical protein